ncbi:MAG: hypothetical protein HY749_17300 [Gammaproteobacteria bacterium]|nr:hypothetical protein [Gammaproteobacteria bacterium]MBI5616422.1 hypothetical protein [Gammaproteobacteria bacterium]
MNVAIEERLVIPELPGMHRGWRDLVEQIDLLEELIADVRNAGDASGEYILPELQRMLTGRRRTLREHLDAGAR